MVGRFQVRNGLPVRYLVKVYQEQNVAQHGTADRQRRIVHSLASGFVIIASEYDRLAIQVTPSSPRMMPSPAPPGIVKAR